MSMMRAPRTSHASSQPSFGLSSVFDAVKLTISSGPVMIIPVSATPPSSSGPPSPSDPSPPHPASANESTPTIKPRSIRTFISTAELSDVDQILRDFFAHVEEAFFAAVALRRCSGHGHFRFEIDQLAVEHAALSKARDPRAQDVARGQRFAELD